MAISLDGSARRASFAWSKLWLRVLAVIGVLLILERTATWYTWDESDSARQSFSAISKLGVHLPWSPAVESHVDDAAVESTVRKTIVVASMQQENTDWVNEAFPDWEIATYVANNKSAEFTVLKNEGHEASIFLTYIVNNYYNLPDYMVFIHAQRYQWHNDDPMYDGIPPLKNLQLESVDKEGYVSLRCDLYPGCPKGGKNSEHGMTPDTTGKDDLFGYTHLYAEAHKTFFPSQRVPKHVSAPCCGQFAVSKAQVQARPVASYELYREWLWHVKDTSAKTGRVFEYMWHLIFGKPAIYCPPADQCYCKNFGLCDLKCPKPNKACLGRYKSIPYMDTSLPKHWPKKGQGSKDSWPVDKWWEEFYPPSEYDGFHLRNSTKTAGIEMLQPRSSTTEFSVLPTTATAVETSHTSRGADLPGSVDEPADSRQAVPPGIPADPAAPAKRSRTPRSGP